MNKRFSSLGGIFRRKPDKGCDFRITLGGDFFFCVELDYLRQVHGIGRAVDDVSAGIGSAGLVRH